MITKKTVNGKELITSCTLANCCLTVEVIEGETTLSDPQLKLANEHGQELTCTGSEFAEIAEYLYFGGAIKLNKIKDFLTKQR